MKNKDNSTTSETQISQKKLIGTINIEVYKTLDGYSFNVDRKKLTELELKAVFCMLADTYGKTTIGSSDIPNS